jgi:hypothetical protein
MEDQFLFYSKVTAAVLEIPSSLNEEETEQNLQE